MPALDLDRDVELETLHVEGVEGAIVGRQAEPVRIAVSTDELELLHRALELAHPGGDVKRIDPGEAEEPVRRFAGDRAHVVVADGRDTEVLRGDQTELDARVIHCRDESRRGVRLVPEADLDQGLALSGIDVDAVADLARVRKHADVDRTVASHGLLLVGEFGTERGARRPRPRSDVSIAEARG